MRRAPLDWSLKSVLLAIGVLLGSALCPCIASEPTQLIIYSYESILGSGGLGETMFPWFEKKYSCKIRSMSIGSGAQIVSRLAMDAARGKTTAHLILGLDQVTWLAVKPYTEPWLTWRPRGFARILPEAQMDPGFVSFDYSYLSLISDRQTLPGEWVPEISFKDLLKPEWRRKVILQDPRTSTPGLSFLLFSQQVLGAGTRQFWNALKQQWLTLTPGWDSAYPLFMAQQAPLVWSYLTSEAFHRSRLPIQSYKGSQVQTKNTAASLDSSRYRAILFHEGQPVQIEGAALIKGTLAASKQGVLARKFLSFLLSPEVQVQIPKTQWMLPAVIGTPLPASFEQLPKPRRVVPIQYDAATVKKSLYDWNLNVSGG